MRTCCMGTKGCGYIGNAAHECQRPSPPPMRFRLRAKDPCGEFVEMYWEAAIIPRIGDTLILRDHTGGEQDVQVSDVLLYRDGRVDVWLDGFDGWGAGSVCSLFNSSGVARVVR